MLGVEAQARATQQHSSQIAGLKAVVIKKLELQHLVSYSIYCAGWTVHILKRTDDTQDTAM